MKASEKLTDLLKTSLNISLNNQKSWPSADKAYLKQPSNSKDDVNQLNLVKNQNDIYECRGRIQGDYLIYILKAGNAA